MQEQKALAVNGFVGVLVVVAMINNLMVSIVSDRAAQPVINTGTLHS